MGDAYKCIATRSAAQPSDCTDSQQCLAGLLQNPETAKNKACYTAVLKQIAANELLAGKSASKATRMAGSKDAGPYT
jgi:hypothetical protein